MKKLLAVLLCLTLFTGCSPKQEEPKTIKIAAAASLENAFEEEIIPLYEKEHNVKIEGTYDSSGKLQAQIESGLEVDIFFSAATKQMDALVAGKYINESDVVQLLKNNLVLIKRKDTKTSVTSFEDIDKASSIALGDPASVPAGQYAQEVLGYYNLTDKVEGKASYATNVTEALNWVDSGSCEVGVVYQSDAMSLDSVEIIAKAKDETLKTPIIYPVGLLENASEEGKEFLEFLKSEEVLKIFEKYGLEG